MSLQINTNLLLDFVSLESFMVADYYHAMRRREY